VCYLLDGHRRYEAICRIGIHSPEVLSADYPVVYIEAEDVAEAKHILLLVTSQFGKITPKGLASFIKDCPKLDLKSVSIRARLPKVHAPRAPKEAPTHVVLKVKVAADKVKAVASVLDQLSYVEIL